MKTEIARNTVINLIKNFLNLIIGIILIRYMLRELGTAIYGLFVLIGAITGEIDFFQFGIGSSVTKYAAEYRAQGKNEKLQVLINSSFLLFLFMGAILCLGLFVFILLFLNIVFNIPPDLLGQAKIYAVLMIVVFLTNYCSQSFIRLIEGFQRYDILAVIETGRNFLRFLMIIILLASGYSLVSIGVVNLTLSFLSIVIAFSIAKKMVPSFRLLFFPVDLKEMKKIFIFSWSLILSKVNSFLGEKLNTWIIGAFMPINSVAIYSIAAKIHEVGRMPLPWMSSALLPATSHLDAKGEKERLIELFLRGSKYTVAVTLPVVLSGIVLAEYIIKFWLGEEFLSATVLTQVFLSHLLFTMLIAVGGQMLIGMDKFQQLVKYIVAATVINLVISFYLIVRIGAMGVVIGSVVGNILIALIHIVFIFKELKLSKTRFFTEVCLKGYTGAVFTYLLLYFFADSYPPANFFMLLVYGFIALCIYESIFIVFGLNKEEKNDLKEFSKKALTRLQFS